MYKLNDLANKQRKMNMMMHIFHADKENKVKKINPDVIFEKIDSFKDNMKKRRKHLKLAKKDCVNKRDKFLTSNISSI